MNQKEARQRIAKLKRLIERYRYAYHVLDKPLVSDAVNDSLKHELQELETQFPSLITADSPTQRVGGKPLDKFIKVRHQIPMLSLTDIFSFQELVEWEERLGRLAGRKPNDYFVEFKIDGLAVSLHYRRGQFVQGVTRGNGRVGEDVTQNLRTIEGIPLEISSKQGRFLSFEVRGEVYMSKAVFKKLNKKYQAEGKPLLANPRNGAAGSIRQLDPRLAAERKLDFFAYDILMTPEPASHQEKHILLRKLGFPTVQGKRCQSLAEVEKFYQKTIQEREHLVYLIDGIWVGVNKTSLFNRLGSIGKAPRGAIAYKFPAEERTTILTRIVNQVGRSGKITPVAIMKPVNLAGSIVTRATLHNWEEVIKKDIRLGDTVVVRKAGDVIPEIVRALKDLRSQSTRRAVVPTRCPNCGHRLVKLKKNQVDLYCPNKNCALVRQRQLEHFVAKSGFDIHGLGKKILQQLIGAGLILNEADIFKLNQDDLLPLDRFSNQSAQNLILAIQQAKKIPLARFISALGIRHIGEVAANQLANSFNLKREALTPIEFFRQLRQKRAADWEKLPDIGGETAKALTDYFSLPQHQDLMRQLTQAGVRLVLPPKIEQTLQNKNFVITGSLEKFSREEAENQIRLRGGQARASVSAETDFLVLGKNPGSKLKRAKALGIKIIDEKHFLKLIQSKHSREK